MRLYREAMVTWQRLGLACFDLGMSRCDVTDYEWRVIEPLLPSKPRGLPMTAGSERHLLGDLNPLRHAPSQNT